MPPKRKHTSYTFQQKLEIVSRIRNGETQAKVSREQGIPESTLRGWLKDEGKIRDFTDELDQPEGMARKRARTAQDPVVDRALYSWFVEKRADGTPISGPILQSQATQIAQTLHGDSNTLLCSEGWLARWKRRHGIRSVRITGEIRSADVEAAEAFLPQLQAIVEEEDLVADQIYNADETGLFYRMTSPSTLAERSDPLGASGHKLRKDRVTALVGTNWSGTHKLKPLVIGKFAKPRCFHHVPMDTLPVTYRHTKNSWMTSGIFQEWFHHEFVPSVRAHLLRQGLPVKAILLLDNCPAHPPKESLVSRDGRIRVVYLPPNTTSRIQPMDQGIISVFKRRYRREMMSDHASDVRSIEAYLKALTLKDVVHLMGRAWNGVTQVGIQATWSKALGDPWGHDADTSTDTFLGFTDEDIEASREHLERLVPSAPTTLKAFINEWAAVDDDCPAYAPTSSDDHLADAMQDEEEPEEPEDLAPPPAKVPSLTTALECAQTLITLFESTGEVLEVTKMQTVLQRLKKDLYDSKKQSSIQDFFKRC